MQALFQADLNPGAGPRDRSRFLKARLRSVPLVAFAEELIEGVHRERAALDAELDARSHQWRVRRMAATDRAILRIAVYELLHTETPGPVVADEAIELARRYGNEASPRFVAGIVGRLLAERQGAAASPREGGSP